jgi:hypothetical protein
MESGFSFEFGGGHTPLPLSVTLSCYTTPENLYSRTCLFFNLSFCFSYVWLAQCSTQKAKSTKSKEYKHKDMRNKKARLGLWRLASFLFCFADSRRAELPKNAHLFKTKNRTCGQ